MSNPRPVRLFALFFFFLFLFACGAPGPSDLLVGEVEPLEKWGDGNADVREEFDLVEPVDGVRTRDGPGPFALTCLALHEDDPAQVYFSKSCKDPAACPCSPVDLGKVIAHHILRSRLSVDVAVMELQHFSVSDALIAAHQRGVDVRIVMDNWYADPDQEPAVKELVSEGLEIVTDAPSEKLMHSKFVVIDSETVLVSSGNFSTYEGQSNANSLLVFRSPSLAAIFTNKFESMHDLHIFHKTGAAGPHRVTIDGWTVEVFFGPDWALMERVSQAALAAQQAVHFSIFAFTLAEVKAALNAKCGQTELLGVYDPEQAQAWNSQAASGWCPESTVLPANVQASFGFKKLHHKVLIVDPALPSGLTIAGSANWSYSAATRNDEVMVVVHDPNLVLSYESEFQARFQEAQ